MWAFSGLYSLYCSTKQVIIKIWFVLEIWIKRLGGRGGGGVGGYQKLLRFQAEEE